MLYARSALTVRWKNTRGSAIASDGLKGAQKSTGSGE